MTFGKRGEDEPNEKERNLFLRRGKAELKVESLEWL